MAGRMRWRFGPLLAACLLPQAALASHVVLGEALSRIDLMCNSAQGPQGDFPEGVFGECEGQPTTTQETGTTRATASSGFGDLLLVAASTECVACPFAPSTRSSSRVLFELAVTQQAPPPAATPEVPVRITTQGEVGVSNLGLLAGGGTYLSSTLQVIFTSADVFAHTMQTNPPSGSVVADDYAITETVWLVPDHVYYGNVYVGCNQNSSLLGDWACSGNASVSFALDQAAFDASRGAESFDLAQSFAVARSPNLVPEASAPLVGAAAAASLALCARARRREPARGRQPRSREPVHERRSPIRDSVRHGGASPPSKGTPS